MLAFCALAGLYLVWTNKEWSQKQRAIWTAGWAAPFLALLLVFPVSIVLVNVATTFAVALLFAWGHPSLSLVQRNVATAACVAGLFFFICAGGTYSLVRSLKSSRIEGEMAFEKMLQ